MTFNHNSVWFGNGGRSIFLILANQFSKVIHFKGKRF